MIHSNNTLLSYSANTIEIIIICYNPYYIPP